MSKAAEIQLLDKVNRALPGFSFSESKVEDVLKQIDRLKSQEKRKQFFDAAIVRMERGASNGWGGIYATLAAMRTCEWYWNDQYDSFEDFLAEECRIPFEEFCKLEVSYHFAQEVASRCEVIDKLKRLKNVSGVKPDGGDRKSKKYQSVAQNKQHSDPTPESTEAELDLDAQSDEFKAGYGSRGSTNKVYRFARLKRDAPKIAADVIEGKYNRKLANGTWIVDLKAAEQAAEKRYPAKYKRPTQKSRAKSPLQKAMDAVSKLDASEWNELVVWMNKQ